VLDFILQFAAEEALVAEELGEASESGLAALGIDPIAILIQSGTFLLLFFLIKRYAMDKINNSLSSREQTINEGIQNAHKAQKASEEAVEKQQQILAAARKDADKIIAEANTETGKMLAAAATSAEVKSQKILDDTRSQLDAEIAKASKKLENDVFKLVAQASEVVLGEKMDSKSDEKLIERAVKETKS